MPATAVRFLTSLLPALALAICGLVATAPETRAGVTAFKQAVAESAARDDDLAAFYRANGYRGIWTANEGEDRARRRALLEAIEDAEHHGLPPARYRPESLKSMMRDARTPRDLGRIEVELSRTFLQLARDMQTGLLVPREIDRGIVREVPYRSRSELLLNFSRANPRAFFRALPPQSAEYSRLMREKRRLGALMARGGWGPTVPAAALEPGESGPGVVALRDRLIAMGFMARSASAVYDDRLRDAVQDFQVAHGLEPDGVAGASTIAEINTPVSERIQSIMVAMERERWNNQPRGERHILVNLTDFSARIVDNDKVTFQTRSVIGKDVPDRRSPEFSDEMEYMEINPVWNVPRSIAVKEYLPQMQRNRGAAGHLKLYNARGQQVSRAHVNFNAYNARNFPFNLKQPPSSRNALGLVKFMFPNRYNIYLHDTPAKNLFARNKRDYSHGCIRLQEPFDFAYALLARQETDPKGYFHRILNTGQQTQVRLEKKVPVHIIYRTAFTQARGHTNYRNDVYGRDARIWDALRRAGVSLHAVRG
ncbi:L,D-transpeptidase family protein [Roseovarius sp. SCSIO 43702]|uniref:L,D-transpeptidase family protein n=1 Tax=Roseovarius sp. SCSIO 43702 TaxID=2823043 RepID=UPI001C72AC64|nr:L,D-transpeptidase family protein [Roseovarius sp. SCSIO 43702]QYX55320.1 L,D-transpeptidase family protein [Roseovarius sp. SCSIO 43702]